MFDEINDIRNMRSVKKNVDKVNHAHHFDLYECITNT